MLLNIKLDEYMKVKIASLIVILLFGSITACKKKETDPEETNSVRSEPTLKIDLTNPEVTKVIQPKFEVLDASSVTNSIKIDSAKVLDGMPPASTGEFNTPSIATYDTNTIRAKSGGEFNLSIDGSQFSDVVGIYLQVQGSDEYLEIPTTTAQGRGKNRTVQRRGLTKHGRATFSSDNLDIQIEVPSSIKQGKFCATYCLFTADGRISNAITRCVEVQEFGGSIPFAGSWNLVDMTFKVDSLELISFTTGEWFDFDSFFTFEDDVEVPCLENNRLKFDKAVITLSNAGGWESQAEVTIQSQETIYDYDTLTFESTTSCGPITTEEDNGGTNGAWSYDETTQVLTVLYDEEEDFYDSYFEQYKVFHDGNNLRLLLEEGGNIYTHNLQR